VGHHVEIRHHREVRVHDVEPLVLRAGRPAERARQELVPQRGARELAERGPVVCVGCVDKCEREAAGLLGRGGRDHVAAGRRGQGQGYLHVV
jgi:hypothetical protein